MSEQAIPADILETAETQVIPVGLNGNHYRSTLVHHIAQALLAERQKHDRPTSTLPSFETTGEAAAGAELIAEAIKEHWGDQCPDFDENCACCLAWKQYDDLTADCPTSPDLQAEAERVFAEIDRLVQVKDVVIALAKALQAAKNEEREICALICEAMASTDSEWPEADAALRRAAKNIRGA